MDAEIFLETGKIEPSKEEGKISVSTFLETGKPEAYPQNIVEQSQGQSPLMGRLLDYERQIQEAKQLDPANRLLRTGGIASRAGADIIGSGVSAVTPDIIEEPVKNILGGIARGAYNLPTGVGRGETVGESLGGLYSKVKQAAPQNVQRLEDTLSIMAMLSPEAKVGKRISKSGIDAARRLDMEHLANLAKEPITTKDIVKGKVQDTFFGRKKTLDKFEKDMVNQVTQVQGVSRFKSPVNNTNLVVKAANDEAGNLLETLKQSKIKYKPSAIKKGINSVVSELEKNPFLVKEGGGLKVTAKTIVKTFENIIDKNEKTPAGLLKARREFDNKMLSFSSNVFDPKNENIRSIVTKALRTRTNNFIADHVKEIDVKDSLYKQHLLYSAAENMANKAKKTAETAAGRAVQSATQKIPLKAGIAGLGGLGALGYGGYLTPQTALGGIGLYGAYKGAKAPATRRFLGGQLSELERIRAPQAGIINYMNQQENQQ